MTIATRILMLFSSSEVRSSVSYLASLVSFLGLSFDSVYCRRYPRWMKISMLRQSKGKNDNPRIETKEAKKVIEDLTSEEENNVSTPVVRVISLLEGFLSTPVEDEDGSMKHFTMHMGTWEDFPKHILFSKEKKGYLPLSFYKEEVPRGSPNYKIPLLVRDFTANFDVHKILVNQGSSCDVMCTELF
ncbi:hypothetical protein L195_g019725 [Trifolium pratense]|uniref:Uncharacterized protein n=1 Tax=Trifolium pratense TaxID=57577 RepID=A0A2K3N0I3_TRIPR|nr:hypothetical protein L195_g019725 [Trifolium pratense]